jgi:outer membrane protein OmpA-like peptidoglycan-associated protein
MFLLILLLIPTTFVCAENISFIACPVYRDTDAGPKSGCWLATERDSGITYDIGSGLTKPIAEQAVLVEGVVGENSLENSELCGGIVLTPVRVSVLEQVCHPHILPAENFPGRVFRPPGEVMQPLSVSRTLPQPPFADQTFSILFNYNSDFLNYQYSEVILEKASLYIKASGAENIEVIGYAATQTLNVSGHNLQEPDQLARRRAEKVALALSRLGVSKSQIAIRAKKQGDAVAHYAGGLAQETLRRVDIRITVPGN